MMRGLKGRELLCLQKLQTFEWHHMQKASARVEERVLVKQMKLDSKIIQDNGILLSINCHYRFKSDVSHLYPHLH